MGDDKLPHHKAAITGVHVPVLHIVCQHSDYLRVIQICIICIMAACKSVAFEQRGGELEIQMSLWDIVINIVI